MREAIRETLRAAEEFGRSHEGMYNIPPETGQFLRSLVISTKARRVLEVGMSDGYSTLWLASALEEIGGGVISLEQADEKVRLARENFRRAGLEGVVKIEHADAREAVQHLDGPFDLVFIDAWKQDYPYYFQQAYPKVVPGGLILADNAISHQEELAPYLQAVRNHPGCESVLVPIGSGVEMTLKVR
jgi:predicted O-methyltransferase YrrM